MNRAQLLAQVEIALVLLDLISVSVQYRPRARADFALDAPRGI